MFGQSRGTSSYTCSNSLFDESDIVGLVILRFKAELVHGCVSLMVLGGLSIDEVLCWH